ncbi:sulfurtransferase-like selenium metabolism protein YedF [Azotosporobacter soli]|uniref:sulfurtransferase-like selenium metabolism protein YedF n=1 Tax=Azotosporobacter soli TaxID=3055040 RepID=UPI0031FE9ADE
MSMIKVDARGLGCPQPVIVTKRALDSMAEGMVTTLVDNAVSKENVVKFASNCGYGVRVEEESGDFSITILKGTPGEEEEVGQLTGSVYLITGDTLGRGDAQLGALLMKAFFVSLQEIQPKRIFLLNSAVKLATASSPVLEAINQLKQKGTQIMSCGTCLDFYGLKEQLAVGEVTNMYVILEGLNGPDRVITL